jgi:COP9 signalosome complex subunit 12
LDGFPILDEIYAPFITAVRAGDVKAFDVALEKWQRRLLELNIWLALEKARELCIRGLFRRVCVKCASFSIDSLLTVIIVG